MNNQVDLYISQFPEEVQIKLEEIRQLIKKAAPKAEEIISYKMPAYKQIGVLVYFAGYKNHIGFYPTGRGIEAFKNEFEGYKWSKGAVQFPLTQKLPKKLIESMVKWRIKDEEQRAQLKKTK